MTDQADLFDPAESLDWRKAHYLVDASNAKHCCRWCRWYIKGDCELKRRVMPDGHVWLRGTCDYFEASA